MHTTNKASRTKHSYSEINSRLTSKKQWNEFAVVVYIVTISRLKWLSSSHHYHVATYRVTWFSVILLARVSWDGIVWECCIRKKCTTCARTHFTIKLKFSATKYISRRRALPQKNIVKQNKLCIFLLIGHMHVGRISSGFWFSGFLSEWGQLHPIIIYKSKLRLFLSRRAWRIFSRPRNIHKISKCLSLNVCECFVVVIKFVNFFPGVVSPNRNMLLVPPVQ